MEKAKIGIIEDCGPVRQCLVQSLVKFGHTVVSEAVNIKQARQLIEKASKGDLNLDLIILDSDLSGTSNNGKDAHKIVELAQESGLTARIIGFGRDPMSSFNIDVDIDCTKSRMWQLPNIISGLESVQEIID